MVQFIPKDRIREINQGLFIIKSVPLGRELLHHNDTGIFQLGRLDHAILHPGVLIGMHLHRDDEILSYMRKGTMHHKDSNGNDIAINNQYLMMMNAGSGFYHEEAVHKEDEMVEMLQIFFRPRKDGLTPNVQFHQFSEPILVNQWRLIGGSENSEAPLKINTEAKLFDVLLKSQSIQTPKLEENKVGLLYVFDGNASVNNGQLIEKGDMLYFDEPLNLRTDKEATLVYLELDTQAEFSRNGLFAK